jgi:hypothetical protein
MAITTRLMQEVTPRQVFDVLRDGRSYQVWVVGTRAIRAVDAGWPSPGSRIHYTVGYGPLRKDDVTSARAYEPDARLELEAHAWPAGTAGIVLTAEPVEDGTRVAIDEAPRRGPARLLHNPLAAAAIRLRNVETLRRLEAQARLR